MKTPDMPFVTRTPADLSDLPTLAALVAERDGLVDRFADLEAEHADALDEHWEAHALASDARAAQAASAAGKDPMKAPSTVEATRTRRARAIGGLRDLAQRIAKLDRKVQNELAANAGLLDERHAAEMAHAADAYRQAYAQLIAARAAFGGAAKRRRWSHNLPGDPGSIYPGEGGARPQLSNGSHVYDAGTELIGGAEVAAVLDSFEAAGITADPADSTPVAPSVFVRSKANGTVMKMTADRARQLIEAGSVEITEDEDA